MLEILIGAVGTAAVLYGVYHEQELIDWEDRAIARIKEFNEIMGQYLRKKVLKWRKG